MQNVKCLFFIVMAATLELVACKKDTGELVPTVSLNVINASPGVTLAQVRTSYVTAAYYSQMQGVSYGNSAIFTIGSGNNEIKVNPFSDTSGKSSHSTVINGNGGDVFSFFIGGAGGADILVNKDTIPYHSDSSFGLRFVNMSYNSTPVNIGLANSNANEFTNIAYKGITNFKVYDAHVSVLAPYIYQVKDRDGNLLATSPAISAVTPPGQLPRLHHNVTLVLTGVVGGSGTNALKVFTVNNY